MKKYFLAALKIFKFLAIVNTIIFWPYIIYDDWGFWLKYGRNHWQEYLEMDFLYWIAYLFTLGIYYWVIATGFILLRLLTLTVMDKIEH